MGCLNDKDNAHWFGNIHLSGPCNRACYFCIGQHMMALDALNNLDTWPMPGWDDFVSECDTRGVREVYLTGSNTDPALYRHAPRLIESVRTFADRVGVRINGAHVMDWFGLLDQISVSVTSFDSDLYRLTMGRGAPPSIQALWTVAPDADIWANVVLCPETVRTGDVIRTLARLRDEGVTKANLREPYGQPHVGDPLAEWGHQTGRLYGNPQYDFHGLEVTYWDVHYTAVSSVNLYASGRVSTDYPVTKGHAETGTVMSQGHFHQGRNVQQWCSLPPEQRRGQG